MTRPDPPPPPSITAVRARLNALFARALASDPPKDVVVLALDGVPFSLARAAWPEALVEEMQAVFPTTSATCWLSSLTGLSVDEHGVPGVVFVGDDGAMINVYGPGTAPPLPSGNVFSDARYAGLRPVAILGDLAPFDCIWRDLMLRDAERVEGSVLFATSDAGSPEEIAGRLSAAIATTRRTGAPAFIWAFVDCDWHIHRHGYDAPLLAFLALVDDLAKTLSRDGVLVAAHADHGLVETQHDPDLDAALRGLAETAGCRVGGAGRTRWIHAPANLRAQIAHELERRFSPDVAIERADQRFTPGSPAHRRAGDILLVAKSSRFLAEPGILFEHGGDSEIELAVPYAVWSA